MNEINEKERVLIKSFKDLTDKKDIVINGPGTFHIGLSAHGYLALADAEGTLCMSLLELNILENDGCILTALNKDLKCVVNSTKELKGELNLIDGTRLEIAHKKLQFINGPIPKRRRRQLPATPGTGISNDPPVKPTRNSLTKTRNSLDIPSKDGVHQNTTDNTDTTQEDGDEHKDDDKQWLENSLCMHDLPASQYEEMSTFNSPEQTGILAASYFTKQLRMFTDANVTSALLDDIFKLFMDTICTCKTVYQEYLISVERVLARHPDRAHTKPMHKPAVILLTDLLKVCMEPIARVILLLDLLRTFSHFDGNLEIMIRYQTTATVLGSMAVYLESAIVQQYSMDILAKIAKFKPTLENKAPLREAGVDLVIRGVTRHSSNISIARGACRVLSNVTSTVTGVLDRVLETEISQNKAAADATGKYEDLLTYIFQEGIPVVQSILKEFSTDIGVSTEGRKFIYYYARFPQLQLKKSKWLATQETKNQHEEETQDFTENDNDSGQGSPKEQLSYEGDVSPDLNNDSSPQGILKKARSYENLRTSDRRLEFTGDTIGGSDSESEPSECDTTSDADDEIEASTKLENEQEFSNHLVKHLINKTLKRRISVRDDLQTHDQNEEVLSVEEDYDFLTELPLNTNTFKSHDSRNDSETHSVKADKNITESAIHTNANDIESSIQPAFDSKESKITVSHEDNKEFSKKEQTKPAHVLNDSTGLEQQRKQTDCSKSVVGHKDEITNQTHDVNDVYFLGKLVRTQIIVHVGCLVFQGDDSKVLLVIDQSIVSLLTTARASHGLVEYAGNQYGDKMTLMDLDPAIVISIIDAVRYRAVTKNLVQSSVLSITRALSGNLSQSTINIVMLLYKALFADTHLHDIVTDESFLAEFRSCFHNATERLQSNHNIEEIRQQLASPSFVI